MILKEGIPRHTQISNWLRAQIDRGEFKADDKLPSENELAKKFDVSRVTIRRALQSLEGESIIYRCQGLGSFVSENRATHNLIRLTDFNEDMIRAGLTPSSQVKKFEMTEAQEWLAAQLQLDEGCKVLQIDRLRFANGEPIAYDCTWLPVFYGQLLNEEALEDSTIYKILEKEYNIPVTKGSYRMSAEVADEQMAAELNVPVNTPLFLIDRLSYTLGGKPLYYQKRFYRNDRVIYEMTLERSSGNNSHGEEMPLKEFSPVFKS
ncbi:MAG: GntR family transcriptional regulator [Balneolaceae bacterium]|nr:MAG: GntR family transcriptional regulator [Balneolaceae bacterium]